MVQDNCMKYPWTMFNSLRPSDAYMRHENKPSLIRIMACRLFGASHYLNQCGIMWIGPGEQIYEILIKYNTFIQENASENVIWKIAANLTRPHCVNNLVTISTTTKFGKWSAELIIMRGELMSVSHARWRHSCQRLCLLKYPLGFQWSPSTLVFTRDQFWPPGIVVACVRPLVRHQVCPHDNSSPVQARITKFGPKV